MLPCLCSQKVVVSATRKGEQRDSYIETIYQFLFLNLSMESIFELYLQMFGIYVSEQYYKSTFQ